MILIDTEDREKLSKYYTFFVMYIIFYINFLVYIQAIDDYKHNNYIGTSIDTTSEIYSNDIFNVDINIDIDEKAKVLDSTAVEAFIEVLDCAKIDFEMLYNIDEEPSHANKTQTNHTVNNIFNKSNLSEKEINELLKGTELKGYGNIFIEMEETYNINALFAISVSAQESGYGKSTLGTKYNNIFGFKGKSGWMKFKDKRDCILYFGNLMNKSTYKNKNIYEIAEIYCDKEWAYYIINISTKLEKSTNQYRDTNK